MFSSFSGEKYEHTRNKATKNTTISILKLYGAVIVVVSSHVFNGI